MPYQIIEPPDTCYLIFEDNQWFCLNLYGEETKQRRTGRYEFPVAFDGRLNQLVANVAASLNKKSTDPSVFDGIDTLLTLQGELK